MLAWRIARPFTEEGGTGLVNVGSRYLKVRRTRAEGFFYCCTGYILPSLVRTKAERYASTNISETYRFKLSTYIGLK